MRQSLILGWGRWQDQGQDLYHWLLERALSDLPASTRLVFDCCDTLSWVPFAALHNKQKHLIEEYEICHRSRLNGVIKKISTTDEIAIFPCHKDRHRAMPGVAKEIQMIADVYKKQCGLDSSHKEVTMVELLETQPSVTHLAGHFELALQSDESHFEFYNSYDLLLPVILEHNWTCDMVYLSACNTGVRALTTKQLATRSRFSLADCLIERGAKSAVATLWDIRDSNTADFVEKFYRALQKYRDPAMALASVQRQFATGATGNRGQWAAYQCYV